MRPCFSHLALVIAGNCCPACNCPSPAAHRTSTISVTRRDSRAIGAPTCRAQGQSTGRALPGHLIIGSDQAAVLGRDILGKPHTFERAKLQLQAASGSKVTFLTGLALLNSETGTIQTDCVPFTVHFRTLDEARIERYLKAEQPFDCAGSFKAEGLGISLFRSTEGEDVTSGGTAADSHGRHATERRHRHSLTTPIHS